MSYYRESPSRYARRSPPRVERELLEEEMALKNALRSEAENRRLADQISVLHIKLRKTEELEVKVEGLLKQNSILVGENQQLARELSERRYQLDRVKAGAAQLQERESLRGAQLGEANRSLELEIQLLKKERLQSNKLYQQHIQKLQFMLEDKIKELDLLSGRCNDLGNQKEVNQIRFEEEKNRLKNLMTRTNHDMERELEYTKEKQTAEKSIEIDTLKKNYSSQIALLEDEIAKLKAANDYKHNQFETQLADNKALRLRHEEELRTIEAENVSLRDKILKLEELNRSEVSNIEVKYKDLQRKDTTLLQQGHIQEIQTLLNEIDKLNWLLREKNQEIQNLIADKKDLKVQEQERELALRAEIDTLKNKLDVQKEKAASDNQDSARRIASLTQKLVRDGESYSQRAAQLTKNINDIEAELKSTNNNLERTRGENAIQQREMQRVLEETEHKLDRTNRELEETKEEFHREKQAHSQTKTNTDKQIKDLHQQNSELQSANEELEGKIARHADHSGDHQKVLEAQIDSLKKNVSVLEQHLEADQKRHAKEMDELSANIRAKVENLQAQQTLTLQQVEAARSNEVGVLEIRIEKAERDREQANKKLREYIERYEHLQKFFKNPQEGSICRERSDSDLYEVLRKVKESTIHIF